MKEMLRWLITVVGVSLMALPFACPAQDQSAPPQQSQPAPANAPKKDQKKTANPNAFPEAQSQQAAQQAQHPDNSGSAASAPQSSSTTPQKPSTADANPFPEAQSEKAAHQAQQPDNPAPPSSGPPRSSDDNYSSSRVKGLDLPEAAGAPAADAAAPMIYNPKLARKDAQIGDFYLESGDFKGAYDRFLEANRSDPGNAEAVFGLADSAQHLHLLDQALRNYRLYLSALPNGPHAKEVRKALKEMGAAPPS